MAAAASTLTRPRFSAADYELLKPADLTATYKPKDLYDLLMALEVPTPTGGRVTVQITPYRLVKEYPKGLTSGGDPEYADLQSKYFKRSRLLAWSHSSWALTVEVRDPIRATDPFGIFDAAPAPALGTFSPLLVPFSRPPSGSRYFASQPAPLDPNHPESLAVHNHEMMRFFTGKAAPPEIRRALFLAQVAGATASDQASVQAYCDAHCGMDCSGMASVIYGYVGKDINAEGFRKRGVERLKIEDFRAGDAIVWDTDNHIAVIERVMPGADSTKINCMVVESTHGTLTRATAGVQYSQYSFECDDTHKTRKFKCFRPSLTGKPTEMAASKLTIRGNP
jgi:hypothetical protein